MVPLEGGDLMADEPTILVIWGDDIGWWNVSAYNHGSMGYQTPGIDRIGREGTKFTWSRRAPHRPVADDGAGDEPAREGLT
jgi:arylsulfatase